ncbi:MAG TPA: hypothetical protein VIY26_16840 [Acidimicrobiales bacterium]
MDDYVVVVFEVPERVVPADSLRQPTMSSQGKVRRWYVALF